MGSKSKKRKHEDSDAITLVGSHSHKESGHKKSKKEKADKTSKEVKQVKQHKPKHTEPPAPKTVPRRTPTAVSSSQTSGSSNETVAEQFDNFRRTLKTLLSTKSDIPELRGALGDRKANFLAALRTMKTSGDLPWLSSPSTSDLSSHSDSGASDSDSDSDPGSDKEADNDSSPPPKALPKTLPKTPSLTLGRPATLSAPTLNWPPPLPEVKSHKLRQQAFTHKSFIKGEEVSIPGTENRHYERLEFLGDSYLQSIASHILYDYFPTHREGSLSEMRQSLVANRPLSTYATLYKFHLRIREGKGQENTSPVMLPSALPSISSGPGSPESESLDKEKEKAPTETNKTLADCFEAYIAALVLDDPVHGVQTAREWLEKLYAPKLAEFAKQYNIAPIDKMAKQTLNTIAGGSRVTIEYRWDGKYGGNKGGYSIEVYLTGWGFKERLIGRGWATNKNDAALRAAMNVIADKEFCDEMTRVRLAVLGPKPPTTNPRTRRNPSTSTPTPPPAATPSSSSGPPQRVKHTKRPVARNADELNYDD
ncbi:uncharacterized protein H6S33_011276 [Morchella sextelata]|uniref:uncharacterized protein n=1 Tax=Morchella sextelata TaxID=1174677 RepID=UPI001D04FCA3|nr:uncharacterized protein H6S33_011276 [Morchella sextelata]KAH0610849.1 hypothetical protein H6S33_011276 [Morchella sextelata]